ncbi:MAG: ATP-binding cassette domain-containing protein [Desulfitobacterium sp.]
MVKVQLQRKLPSFTLEVHFTVDNHILAIVGPSGAGKTTVLQCLAGLQTPSQGEIMINGKTIFSSERNVNLPVRKRRIGYVFQDYALFPHMTIEKNVLYGKPKQTQSSHQSMGVTEILDILQIGHLRQRFPRQISGGEKQRVALARALMTEPELLLLDESLSALDPDTRALLQQELLKVQQQWKIPFIMVTHDPREAEILGSRILRIDKGAQETLK